MEVKIKANHVKDVKNNCNMRVMQALEAIGLQCQEHAADRVPVDTGHLKRSLTHQLGEGCVYVGSNVKYAPYVEFIERYHHNTGQAHFLRDACTKYKDEYKNIEEKYLKG